MKNLIKVLIVVFIASLNCYTSCEEECEKTKIDGMTVDVYAWGTVEFRDQNMFDLPPIEFAGTKFRITYIKEYCNDNRSDELGFDYLSLSDGTLDKVGIGNYSFTMQNELDIIHFQAYYIDDNGENHLLDFNSVGHYDWKDGQVRAKTHIYAYVYEDGSIDYKNSSASFEFLPPPNY